jgi:hypothetical protein
MLSFEDVRFQAGGWPEEGAGETFHRLQRPVWSFAG